MNYLKTVEYLVKNGARIDYYKNVCKFKIFSGIHSNPVDRNWFTSSIILYPAFYDIKMYNHKIKTNLYPLKAVYNM